MRGDIDDPLWLEEAMGLYYRIKPGHTVWLRSGVYDAQSELTCVLQGTAEAPITVRNYPGEIAQIDASLVLSCPYTRWISEDYGLEIIGTQTTRTTDIEGSELPPEMGGHGGITQAADGIELINVRVLNVLNTGIAWFGGYHGLIYGCHIIHNGRIAPDRRHGPGIYTHNNTGVDKRVENTVIVDSFRYGLQFYSDSANSVKNYTVLDTVVVGSGAIFASNYGMVDDLTIDYLWMEDGWLYFGVPGTSTEHGTMTATNLVNRCTYAFSLKSFAIATIAGRFNDTRTEVIEQEGGSDYDLTGCTLGNLSGVDVNLVPNTYAPRFATLTVFDWDASGTVNIDVSAFAESGTLRVHNIILMRSEYRDVEVVAGVLALDMTGWTTPPPLGLDAILTDAYPGDFGCWILEKLEA